MNAVAAYTALASPAKDYWTYADLALVFGTTRVRHLMPAWEAQGFPAPMPWSRKEKRWKPAPVLAWKNRQEIRTRSSEPHLVGGAP